MELPHDVLKHASSGNSLSPSARLNTQPAAACAAARRCRLHTTAVAPWASIGATQHLFFRVSDDGYTASRRLTTPAWPAPYPTWRGTSRRRRSPTEWDQMCTVASPPNLGRGAAKFNNFPRFVPLSSPTKIDIQRQLGLGKKAHFFRDNTRILGKPNDAGYSCNEINYFKSLVSFKFNFV